MENGRVVDAADELERAIALAVRAHRGQRYPSPEAQPYILHPLRVMFGVSGVRARAVAVLHDVLEDTAVTAEDLQEANLSSEVVDAVTALTRRSGQRTRTTSFRSRATRSRARSSLRILQTTSRTTRA